MRTNSPLEALAKDALAQGWLKYDIQQEHCPTVPGADNAPTGFSTYITGRWLWVVDYPRDAQRLQQAIYGTTNIRLDANREDYLAGLFRALKVPPVTTTTTAPATTTRPVMTDSTEASTEEETTETYTAPTETPTEAPTEAPPPETEPPFIEIDLGFDEND